MKAVLVFAFALAGCVPMQQQQVRFVPAQYASCPPGIDVPEAPGVPRTTLDIAKWANKLHDALVKANEARDICAGRLAGLNDWITSGQK